MKIKPLVLLFFLYRYILTMTKTDFILYHSTGTKNCMKLNPRASPFTMPLYLIPAFLDFSLYDACQHNFIRPITNGTLLFPTFCSTLSPEDHKQVLLHMQEIIKLYHTLPTCPLLSIKLHILHMIELFFQADYFYNSNFALA